MTGYTPAEQRRRAALGLPPATGADEPPAWHDQPPGWYYTVCARPETRPAA